MPLGIPLYTVAEPLNKDVAGTLRQLRSIGYRRVETAGFAGLTADEFRRQIDAAGLGCRSAHLVFNKPDPGPVFDDAHALGARFVVTSAMLPPHPGSRGEHGSEDYKQMGDRFNQLGTRAKQAGLQLAYHNHNFEFAALAGVGYDVLLASTDPELVTFELDCGWMVSAEFSPPEYFRRYPHRFTMLHIKDFVKGSKTSTSLTVDRPQGTELGRGHVDYRARRRKTQAYTTSMWSRNLRSLTLPPMEAAKTDYGYLHAITG